MKNKCLNISYYFHLGCPFGQPTKIVVKISAVIVFALTILMQCVILMFVEIALQDISMEMKLQMLVVSFDGIQQCSKCLKYSSFDVIDLFIMWSVILSIIVITGNRCEDGVQLVQCLYNPCDTAQCPNIPDAKCVPSSCGQCSAHFFNTSGHNVTSSCSTW